MLFQTLLAHLNRATPCVWVSVAATQGSTPREAGAGMAVTGDGIGGTISDTIGGTIGGGISGGISGSISSSISGTIGGGHLELKAIELARQWLRLEQQGATRRHYPLGPALGQCCGGAVDLLFRPLTAAERPWLEALAHAEQGGGELVLHTALDAGAPHTALGPAAPLAGGVPDRSGTPAVLVTRHAFCPWHLWVFGAGHVGHALAQVFGTLPCSVTWVDGRAAVFPAALPPNVTVLHSADPPAEVSDIPPGADVLVLTHSHALDLEITTHLLRRDDLGYLGLIGSDTKAQLFRRRLAQRGIDASRLVCPIGMAAANAPASLPSGRKDKHPGAIAVSVAADLLARRAQSRLVDTSPLAAQR